jgi:hypothetical protein
VDDVSDDEEPGKGQMEDVRMSNFAYSQTKIAEYLSFYFAMIGVTSSIIASEISAGYDSDGSKEEYIKQMWIVTNITTFFLSNLHLSHFCSNLNHCEEGIANPMVEVEENIYGPGRPLQHGDVQNNDNRNPPHARHALPQSLQCCLQRVSLSKLFL